MKQKRTVISLLFCLAVLACGSSTAAAQDVKIYGVGESALIEHGDTLKMPLSQGERAILKARLDSARVMKHSTVQSMPDTLTVLLRGDSAFVILSGRAYPMDARLAWHFYNLREIARREAAHPLPTPIVVH
jgi:hypothetical protein